MGGLITYHNMKRDKKETNQENNYTNKDELLIKDALFVRDKGCLKKINFKDILWLKGDGNYTTLVAKGKVYSLRNILKEFEAILPDDEFVRIHKSFLVRIDKIETISPKEVTVVNQKVPVGRTYYQKLIHGINKLGAGA